MAFRRILVALLAISACATDGPTDEGADGGSESADTESAEGESAESESGTDTAEGCNDGGTLCDGYCVDTQNVSEHCGGCGNACTEMEECYDGACHHLCDDGGGDYCSGVCVYTEFDDQNCGGCDIVCERGTSCVESECVPVQECLPVSETEPQADPDGPYGSCSGITPCAAANTCFTACGGVCAPDCESEVDCPAIAGYSPACVEDDFGVGTCQLVCTQTAECPGGMVCSEPLCAWPL